MYKESLAVAANDKDDANYDNIILTNKDTKFFVPVVTLPVKDNQKLSKLLSKRFLSVSEWI